MNRFSNGFLHRRQKNLRRRWRRRWGDTICSSGVYVCNSPIFSIIQSPANSGAKISSISSKKEPSAFGGDKICSSEVYALNSPIFSIIQTPANSRAKISGIPSKKEPFAFGVSSPESPLFAGRKRDLRPRRPRKPVHRARPPPCPKAVGGPLTKAPPTLGGAAGAVPSLKKEGDPENEI